MEHKEPLSIKYFLRNIRIENERNQSTSEANAENNIDENIISTQKMIDEARERRKNKGFIKCDKCEYKSGSKIIMDKHNQDNHTNQTENNQDELKRNTKSKSTTKLINVKNKSKRIYCNMCDRKFNKNETYQNHIKTEHGTENKNNRKVTSTSSQK